MIDEIAKSLIGQGFPGLVVLLVVLALIWLTLWLRSLIDRQAKRCEASEAIMRRRIDDLQDEIRDEVMGQSEACVRSLEKSSAALDRSSAALEKIGKVMESEAVRRNTDRMERAR